ncbi:MAG: tetratricopeptide repeat protein [Vicinamibacterales bacterium]
MPSPTAVLVLAAWLLQAQAAPPDAMADAEAKAARGDLAGAAADLAALLETPDADHGRVLYRLAAVEQRLGRNDAALDHARQAAERLARAGRGGDASDAWNLAAMVEFTRGGFAGAAAHLERAIALSEGADDAARLAEQLGNLGSVHFSVGRYDDAAAAFARARALAEAHGSAAWAARRRAVTEANQAALLQRLGRYGDALAVYRSMMAADAPLPPGQRAQVLVNQGALFRRLGDPYKALEVYDEARTQFAAARLAGGEASVLTNRGIALALDLGDLQAAEAAFSEALTVASAAGLTREALLARLYRGETARRAGRLDPAAADFDAAEAMAASLDAPDEIWKARYGRGRVHLAAGRGDDARADFDRAIAVIEGLRDRLSVPATRAEFFQDKREVFDARIGLGLGADDTAATFALVEQSRARAWRDQRGLDVLTLAGVQARLPADAVLLAYWIAADRAAVIRVTRSDARVVPLTVDTAEVRALDRALRDPAGDAWRRPARALGAALLPGDLLGGAARAIVVPDGPLGAVPFDALLLDTGLVGDRVAVSVLPSAALLAGAAPDPSGWRPPWTRQLAAFGDPLPAADTWADGDRAPRLAASGAEIARLDAVLGGAHQVFLGADARKVALLQVLAEAPPTVLHLATHATADLATGEQSRLLFSRPRPAGRPARSSCARSTPCRWRASIWPC